MTFTEQVKVEGYSNVQVVADFVAVTIEVDNGGDYSELDLYPKESKRLRKALKRAEKRIKRGDL